MSRLLPLDHLEPGQVIVVGGDRFVTVGDALAEAFRPGDRLVVVADTGDLLHIPAAEHAVATEAVDSALAAFAALGSVGDDEISRFFAAFAARLGDDDARAAIVAANQRDVTAAMAAGRSTTRLQLSAQMLDDMVAGLLGWAESPLRREATVATIERVGWRVEARRAPLGVVAFVFEGRPNVFADAAGVVRTGNTVVMRIGSDALGTAEAIVEHAVSPALQESGLPAGTITLVRSRRALPGGRCSPTGGWRWRWRAAQGRPSANSVPWRGSRGHR